MRKDGEGRCEHCGRTFDYHLVHNGFNESCYAYCASCGTTATMDTLYEDRSAEGLPRHRAITKEGERFLSSCPCGGDFKAGASPRCPHCLETLSAVAAAVWLEEQAPGFAGGWRWQRNWEGLDSIVIEGKVVRNPWRDGKAVEHAH